jgi:hypothetical protein
MSRIFVDFHVLLILFGFLALALVGWLVSAQLLLLATLLLVIVPQGVIYCYIMDNRQTGESVLPYLLIQELLVILAALGPLIALMGSKIGISSLFF